jgi:DNA-directed RNA polymerase specialized sigma24 family protein
VKELRSELVSLLPELTRYASALLAAHALPGVEAEEVVNEAFGKMLQAQDSYDPQKGPPIGWAKTIVKRVLIDCARQRGRRQGDQGNRDLGLERVAAPPGKEKWSDGRHARHKQARKAVLLVKEQVSEEDWELFLQRNYYWRQRGEDQPTLLTLADRKGLALSCVAKKVAKVKELLAQALRACGVTTEDELSTTLDKALHRNLGREAASGGGAAAGGQP